ncbi:flagellar protein FliB [Lachnospiraceae bacterium AM25-11LB]|nr:flagellar protein FliB [Lachnospiraceae bacterium AM25-22]RGD09253.1 flagellar protein FliB [Lachnospiraceae bacterium AM25-11LB]RJW13480.1 flagellar protein FliB [Lachnospiraceae bacterium AM25-40]RJW18192.1 flagellar protein FliB [Lachnospiraceae bacterium AM25-39]
MYYRKPHYYDKFSCTADQCPDTCCAGWQIVIDENSLEKYSNVSGDFGIRLLNSIDWREGIFEQYEKRCSFLNAENLCDIYKELGADALCNTCRLYPRHIEEFENLREFSLSLSCPVAAKMILECQEPVRFLEEEDEKEECEEDFEDFDFLLFDCLLEVREKLFSIVQNRTIPIEKRMYCVLKTAKNLQTALDEGELFERDFMAEIELCLQEKAEDFSGNLYKIVQALRKDLLRLEVLREEWKTNLKAADNLFQKGETWYLEKRDRYKAEIRNTIGQEQWDIYKEQLLMFFLYTYFCGAVYDDMIYSKGVLSVISVFWIEEITFWSWAADEGQIEEKNLLETAYRYAREIEHSDENLNLLEEIFDSDERYEPEALRCIFVRERKQHE